MNVFSMERIFKRSERNKNLFFSADTYCYPLMFYMVSDTRLPDCRFCDSEEVAESMLAECNSERPSLVCLWNTAVLSFYGDAIIENAFKKDVALAKSLLQKIYRRKKELLVDDWDKRHVYRQLFDFRSYINRPNVLNEISWNLEYMKEEDLFSFNHVLCNNHFAEEGLLQEFSALSVEEGWHFAINRNHISNWEDMYIENSKYEDEYEGLYIICLQNKEILKMYAQDKTGRKDNDFFKHLCISNSEVGGWNLLLFLEGFFHVTVKKVLNNVYHFCPYVKTEEEITAMCKSSCTTDLHRPDEYLPYGDSTMIDENRCRIDIVFKRRLEPEHEDKRIHAALLLNNNRLAGVAIEMVYDKH